MILNIKNKFETYNLNINKVSQLCGENMILKEYILNSIKMHFSSYKYSEYENSYIDNVMLNGIEVSRKYLDVITIQSKNDLLNYVRLSKNNYMNVWLKHILDNQMFTEDIEDINNILNRIFNNLNNSIYLSSNHIGFDYEIENVFNMVQKTELISTTDYVIEQLTSKELINIFINLIVEINSFKPTKTLVIFNNIDHLLNKSDYKEIYEKFYSISKETDIYFLLGISINGYATITKHSLSDIAVVNDFIYNMPDYQHLVEYINLNYPYNKVWKEDLLSILEHSINQIGIQNENYFQPEIIKIIINKSLGIKKFKNIKPNMLEIAYITE